MNAESSSQPSRIAPFSWAIPLAAAISLTSTGDIIFREDVRVAYEANGDIQEILECLSKATPADVLDWWTGQWVQRGSAYYRPLASMLFYAEYLVFGHNWRAFCLVSWLMQAAVSVLVLLFVSRLLSHRSLRERIVGGLLAVAWFNVPCETKAEGLHWGNRGIARGIMPYWPAQTDIGCLLFSLACLLFWDRWLQGGKRHHLRAAVLAFAAALLFKEHAVILPFLAAALALYRRRPLRLVGVYFVAGVAAVGTYLALRSMLVPEAWTPEFKGVSRTALKLVWYLCEPAFMAVGIGQAWVVVSGALAAACGAIALYVPRRLYLHAFGLILAVFLPPQVLAGNIALPTIGSFAWMLARVTLAFGLAVLVWEQRQRGPAPALAANLVAVHLPILHVLGPHYYYWPVAWWSMLNAVVIAGLGETLKAAYCRAFHLSQDNKAAHSSAVESPAGNLE